MINDGTLNRIIELAIIRKELEMALSETIAEVESLIENGYSGGMASIVASKMDSAESNESFTQ